MKHEQANHAGRTCVAILLGCFTCSVGCSSPSAQKVPLGSGGTACLIGETVAMYGNWGDKKAVVVWSDFQGANSVGGSVSSAHAEYHGRVEHRDGRRIDWKCETSDGTTGTVIINGANYDLTKGRLFLVSTKEGPVRVVQLDRDLSSPASGHSDLERLAKTDEVVTAFVAGSQKSK